jgi:hypothetical protein
MPRLSPESCDLPDRGASVARLLGPCRALDGQGVTSTSAPADALAEISGVAAAALGAATDDGSGVAISGDGVAAARGAGSGAKARIPPSSSAATATPTTRPATIDRRAFMSRGGYQYERSAAPLGDRCYHAAPMRQSADRIRTRIAPALLTALGVMFLAGGVLSWTTTVAADPAPTAEASVAPSATPEAVESATPGPLMTLPPLGSGAPPPVAASFPPDRVATRVRIAGLKIDLPVIGQTAGFPPCDVALYLDDFRLGQPGQGRATYLYAHARTGMFLPMLTASKVANGKRMVGMVVEVWTSDDQRFLYVVTKVKRHVPYDKAVGPAVVATDEQLWLQTSEGRGTQPKLQLFAEPLSQEPSTHAEAHPKPKPVNCA